MEVMNALLERRSCKAYKPDAVPEALLDEVMNAAAYAPSGMGKQSPIILCVTNKEMRDRISRLNAAVMGQGEGFDPFYGAPAVLVVLADKNVRTYLYDGSLAMGNLMHAAWDKGLGSCWIHRAKEVFDSEEGKTILKELGHDTSCLEVGHELELLATQIGYRGVDKLHKVVWQNLRR